MISDGEARLRDGMVRLVFKLERDAEVNDHDDYGIGLQVAADAIKEVLYED